MSRPTTARRRGMPARDPGQPHRVATPLELFFDLVFVVAISQAAISLEHALAENHVLDGVFGYLVVFFSIWWAWINWTWFSSAFDTDDATFRIATFIQMFGVLVLAAGTSAGFVGDLRIAVAGYVIMRLALVSQWVRVAVCNPQMRATALRYAIGITVLQLCWVVRLAFPVPLGKIGFVLFALGELLVPVWAERARATPWHPHHIAERYVLFTIIVLGETVLASVLAVKAGIFGLNLPELLLISVSGFVVVCSMWWLYTERPAQRFLARGNRAAFPWGYGHIVIFSSAAAVGAGISTVVAYRSGAAHIPYGLAAASFAVPVATFVFSVWFIHIRPHHDSRRYTSGYLVTAALVLVTPLFPIALPLTALLMVGCVIACEWADRRQAPQS